MKNYSCEDANGAPIPWYTYPAIEYIRQLDFSQKSVFEFGSGNSTKFWAVRCKSLVSIEDNQEWFNKVKQDLPNSVNFRFLEDKTSYTTAINDHEHNFDVIIVDGNHRFECAKAALSKLSSTGLIILDNADWRENTAKLLRESGLIQVDMSGFGPINGYTWTTSFFFSRNVDLHPKNDRQPVHGVGAIKRTEDTP